MKIRFFANLRELLGTDELDFADDNFPSTVAELRAQLRTAGDQEFAAAMADPNVLCAVNQRVADDAVSVEAGDEVAFFPPMTGG
ncbi:MAG: molybdopterin converting factor subunit 1 [Pseudomonadota bacterium]